MAKGDFLGDFEQLLLLAILRLGRDAYGVSIRREIERRARRAVTIGAVYTTLERLERKELVTSWLAEPTPERGGRAKKFFKLQPAGAAALRNSLRCTRAMLIGLDAKWGWS
jgi:DNA-binding PadR family transcriptional regulator